MRFVNQANWDRTARIVLGLAILYLGWADVVTGGWGTALRVIGFVPLVTGIVGWCPLYALVGFRTNREPAKLVKAG